MSDETTERDPMADYQAQLEEHEFLKREGFNAWADIIFDMFGDKIHEDKRPLIKEALARFLGIGAPKFPDSFPYVPQGPYATIGVPDAEFIEPPPQIFKETSDSGVVAVYDWLTITMGATHAEQHPDGKVYLYNYSDQLFILRGAAAESFWKWQTFTRESMRNGAAGPIAFPVKRMRRRKSRRSA